MPETWWRGAAVYQVYLRSFADGNGDGTGDLAGLRARLDHLSELGIDAIWLNPWYPSPMADGGYDVADYRGIEPSFGTLAEAEAFIAEQGVGQLMSAKELAGHSWAQNKQGMEMDMEHGHEAEGGMDGHGEGEEKTESTQHAGM